MAKASKKTTDVTYVLEMNKREANALTELVLAANHYEGEGEVFVDIYEALTNIGAESDLYMHEIDDGEVIVTLEDDE